MSEYRLASAEHYDEAMTALQFEASAPWQLQMVGALKASAHALLGILRVKQSELALRERGR